MLFRKSKYGGKGIYTGRLVATGDGHLAADEGPHKGCYVAFEGQHYVFLRKGDQSHNERWHTGDHHDINPS